VSTPDSRRIGATGIDPRSVPGSRRRGLTAFWAAGTSYGESEALTLAEHHEYGKAGRGGIDCRGIDTCF